ncbi:MAG: hypothetical protein ACE5DQ_02415 [Candidatus Paceibacterota bacterium]
MSINFRDKNTQIVAGVIILVLLAGFAGLRYFGESSGGGEKRESLLPDVEAFPTVDSSVEVMLVADVLGQEVTLSINNIPSDTDFIEYELSYETGEGLPKGVIGTLEVDGKKSIEKKGITLGTCSSGACVYDEGVESIKTSLRFEGDYGSQVFQEEFEI